MNIKLMAGFLAGTMALATSLYAPVEARHHRFWNQAFYGQNAYYGQMNRNRYQPGAYGLNQNNPGYFRQAQQAQWAQSQGGGAFHGGGFHGNFGHR